MSNTARLIGLTLPITGLGGILLAAAVLLSGCSNPAQVAALCADDPAAFAAGQIAAAVVPAPGVSTAEAIDVGLVHPAIQAACASVGKTAVGVAPGK